MSGGAVRAAFRIDPDGRAEAIDETTLSRWNTESGFVWIHLDRMEVTSGELLRSASSLDPLIIEALLAEETRPRLLRQSDGLLAILRGVNLNPGSDPEDMISIRLWIDSTRVISLASRQLLAVADIGERLSLDRGPKTPGEFLAKLTVGLVERMGPVLSDLEEEIDGLEDDLIKSAAGAMRSKLGILRRTAIALRRYIGPQKDVILRASNEEIAWLKDADRAQLREAADRVARYIEDLDQVRERGSVLQDELSVRLSEQMNRTMYLLSVVAGLFLPLGFLTGLLGINVGGMPGTENPWAFGAVCVVLSSLAAVEVWLFRRWNLLKAA